MLPRSLPKEAAVDDDAAAASGTQARRKSPAKERSRGSAQQVTRRPTEAPEVKERAVLPPLRFEALGPSDFLTAAQLDQLIEENGLQAPGHCPKSHAATKRRSSRRSTGLRVQRRKVATRGGRDTKANRSNAPASVVSGTANAASKERPSPAPTAGSKRAKAIRARLRSTFLKIGKK